MTTTKARTLLAISAVALIAVVASWALWPEGQPRADLQTVAPATTVATTTTTTAPAPPSTTTTTSPPPLQTPSRLRIESLGVDASILPVGLADDGQMEIPPARDVGWYRLGPVPGAAGSAVLAAHIDFGGERGAFFDLGSIAVGAEITVDGDGASQTFRVTQREQIAKDDIQLDRYFTASGPNRITLISCGGAFDRSIGHYQDNLVITAEPVS